MKFQLNTFLNRAFRLRDFILDLIFPIRCLGCKTEGAWLCKKCFRKLEFKKIQACQNCKLPDRFGRLCFDCGKNYSLKGVWVAADYDNPIIAGLIKNLKYHFAKNISIILGNFLTYFLNNLTSQGRISNIDLLLGIDKEKIKKAGQCPDILLKLSECLLVPVPLYKKRQRWRGFNQAERIANIIACNLGISISSNLVRIKNKKAQAGLHEDERKTNLKGCFKWTGQNLENQPIILVDDVITTGSTLNECAKALQESGADEIWGLVVAKG